jgi:hypothetical protein
VECDVRVVGERRPHLGCTGAGDVDGETVAWEAGDHVEDVPCNSSVQGL